MIQNILIASPPRYIHSACFVEVALCLQAALRELGGNPIVINDPKDITGKTIVLGAHLYTSELNLVEHPLVIYNMEQTFLDTYLWTLRQHEVWDYSPLNIRRLGMRGVTAKYCPVAYMSLLENIPKAQEDIDVLFVGSMNERRRKILMELQDRGKKVEYVFGEYGKARNDKIARAKVVLNIHFFQAKIFEIVRCSHLFANQKCVVSEFGEDAQLEEPYYGGAGFGDYDELVDITLNFLNNEWAREAVSSAGYKIFSRKKLTDYLRELV